MSVLSTLLTSLRTVQVMWKRVWVSGRGKIELGTRQSKVNNTVVLESALLVGKWPCSRFLRNNGLCARGVFACLAWVAPKSRETYSLRRNTTTLSCAESRTNLPSEPISANLSQSDADLMYAFRATITGWESAARGLKGTSQMVKDRPQKGRWQRAS
jgi:hypothetical protein